MPRRSAETPPNPYSPLQSGSIEFAVGFAGHMGVLPGAEIGGGRSRRRANTRRDGERLPGPGRTPAELTEDGLEHRQHRACALRADDEIPERLELFPSGRV